MNNEEVADHFEEINSVASKYLTGMTPAQISQELDIPATRVARDINEWKGMASNSDAVRARASEALAGADLHYTKLIRKAYETIDESEMDRNADDLTANQYAQIKLASMKMVADLEAKRIDMLQKAGLLENQELADKLVQQEKESEAIMDIIKNVIGDCPRCKPKVLQRLQGIGNSPTSIVVEGKVNG